jgi:hypothetical protein
MLSRPEMYLHQRADIRIRVRARAIIDLQGGVVRCPVRNLSAGGVEVYGPRKAPAVGTRAEIVLLADGVNLGPLRAELVRPTRHGVAFRFLDVDRQLRARILAAIARM